MLDVPSPEFRQEWPGYPAEFTHFDGIRMHVGNVPRFQSVADYEDQQFREYLSEFMFFDEYSQEWHHPGGHTFKHEEAKDRFSRWRADREQSQEMSGWNVVPECARYMPRDRYLFGFRQHLYMMIEAMQEQPGIEFVVLACGNHLAHYCFQEFDEKLTEHQVELEWIRRQPHPVLRLKNGSTVRFITADNKGVGVHGLRPDYFVIKELNRKDW